MSDVDVCSLPSSLLLATLGHLAPHVGLTLAHRHFTDLAYAGDVAIFLSNESSVMDALEKFRVETSTFGLKLSWPKTRLQNLGTGALSAQSSLTTSLWKVLSNLLTWAVNNEYSPGQSTLS